MGEAAFLFPGQGSQFAGMGKSLADNFPEAREVFQEADEALGFALSKLCFDGPDEDLRLTENTQPCILTVSTAAWRVLERQGLQPRYVAGHSLGEYSALVAAGALQFADAVRLVKKRGRYMQEAVPKGVGGMAAILKLSAEALDSVLEDAAEGEVVSTANYNSPDQIVIAGAIGAVSRAMDLAKAAGAKRAIALPVSAPFHCSLMEPAQRRMKAELDAVQFVDLKLPLVNNWQAAEVRSADAAREGLFQQIPNPVLWTHGIEYLASKGVSRYVEVGPGSVLTGLLRNIDAALSGVKFGEAADLDKLLATV